MLDQSRAGLKYWSPADMMKINWEWSALMGWSADLNRLVKVTYSEQEVMIGSGVADPVGLEVTTGVSMSACSSCTSIRVQHQPGNSSFKTPSLFRTHVLWLTVILFPGCSWRHLQCRKPSTTRSHRSWSWHRSDWNFQHSDGCAWRTGWHRDPCCHLQSNWIGYTWTDHQFLFRIGNFHEPI